MHRLRAICAIFAATAICIDGAAIDGGVEIEARTEGSPQYEVTNDCQTPPSNPGSGERASNITIMLLPGRQGFRMTWNSSADVDMKEGAVAYHLQKVNYAFSTDNNETTLTLECRTFRIKSSRNQSISDMQPITFDYVWLTNDSTNITIYEISLVSYAPNSTGEKIVHYISTVFLRQDWPQSVAIGIPQECDDVRSVSLSFGNLEGRVRFQQFDVGFCVPYSDCIYTDIVTALHTTATFNDVRPSTYEIYVAPHVSAGQCHCGADETSNECVTCGNSIEGLLFSIEDCSRKV